MKLIIDIPDKDYENCKMLAETIGEVLIHHSPSDRIKYFVGVGIPLPKGHGRLIDADDLEHITVCSKTRNSGITRIEAPTIIEADTESEEEDFDDIEAMLEHLWNATVEDHGKYSEG